MKKIKIYIYYNIIDGPWGGGNSFLRSFKKYITNKKSDEYEIVNNITDKYDIFFMNGGHKDQGVYIDLKEIKKLKGNWYTRFFKSHPKIIYRLDGARFKYAGVKSEMDNLQYRASQIADYVIFQSKESLDTFRHLGFKSKNFRIIYNGVDQEVFNTKEKKNWDGKSKLKILSVNWSANINKGFDTIAKISTIPNVESTFVGNWNKDTDPKELKLLDAMPHEELAKVYKENHVFLHASQNDACPNVVLEALSSGLPLIYHKSGGTMEISEKYGVALPSNATKENLVKTVSTMKKNYGVFIKNIENDYANFDISTIAENYLEVFKKVLYGVD